MKVPSAKRLGLYQIPMYESFTLIRNKRGPSTER